MPVEVTPVPVQPLPEADPNSPLSLNARLKIDNERLENDKILNNNNPTALSTSKIQASAQMIEDARVTAQAAAVDRRSQEEEARDQYLDLLLRRLKMPEQNAIAVRDLLKQLARQNSEEGLTSSRGQIEKLAREIAAGLKADDQLLVLANGELSSKKPLADLLAAAERDGLWANNSREIIHVFEETARAMLAEEKALFDALGIVRGSEADLLRANEILSKASPERRAALLSAAEKYAAAEFEKIDGPAFGVSDTSPRALLRDLLAFNLENREAGYQHADFVIELFEKPRPQEDLVEYALMYQEQRAREALDAERADYFKRAEKTRGLLEAAERNRVKQIDKEIDDHSFLSNPLNWVGAELTGYDTSLETNKEVAQQRLQRHLDKQELLRSAETQTQELSARAKAEGAEALRLMREGDTARAREMLNAARRSQQEIEALMKGDKVNLLGNRDLFWAEHRKLSAAHDQVMKNAETTLEVCGYVKTGVAVAGGVAIVVCTGGTALAAGGFVMLAMAPGEALQAGAKLADGEKLGDAALGFAAGNFKNFTHGWLGGGLPYMYAGVTGQMIARTSGQVVNAAGEVISAGGRTFLPWSSGFMSLAERAGGTFAIKFVREGVQFADLIPELIIALRESHLMRQMMGEIPSDERFDPRRADAGGREDSTTKRTGFEFNTKPAAAEDTKTVPGSPPEDTETVPAREISSPTETAAARSDAPDLTFRSFPDSPDRPGTPPPPGVSPAPTTNSGPDRGDKPGDDAPAPAGGSAPRFGPGRREKAEGAMPERETPVIVIIPPVVSGPSREVRIEEDDVRRAFRNSVYVAQDGNEISRAKYVQAEVRDATLPEADLQQARAQVAAQRAVATATAAAESQGVPAGQTVPKADLIAEARALSVANANSNTNSNANSNSLGQAEKAATARSETIAAATARPAAVAETEKVIVSIPTPVSERKEIFIGPERSSTANSASAAAASAAPAAEQRAETVRPAAKSQIFTTKLSLEETQPAPSVRKESKAESAGGVKLEQPEIVAAEAEAIPAETIAAEGEALDNGADLSRSLRKEKLLKAKLKEAEIERLIELFLQQFMLQSELHQRALRKLIAKQLGLDEFDPELLEALEIEIEEAEPAAAENKPVSLKPEIIRTRAEIYRELLEVNSRTAESTSDKSTK